MDRRVRPSSRLRSIRGRRTTATLLTSVSSRQTRGRCCASLASTRRRQAGARASRSTRPGARGRVTTSMRLRRSRERISRGAAGSRLKGEATTPGCSDPPGSSRRTSRRSPPPLVLRPPTAARLDPPTSGSTRPCAAINGSFRGSRRPSPGSRRAATSRFDQFNLPRRSKPCLGRAPRSPAPRKRPALAPPPVRGRRLRLRRSRVN